MVLIQRFYPRLARFFVKSEGLVQSLFQSLLWTGAYGLWIVSIRLLTLTFITYFTISPNSHLQDITDAFASNELSLMGFSAILFIAFLHSLFPAVHPPLFEIVGRDQVEKNFLPAFVQGSFLASALVLGFILIGYYDYLGYYIQLDEAPLELANVLLRILALLGLAFFETYFFHNLIRKGTDEALPPFWSALWIALLYCGIKSIQFELGLMQILTLFLLSFALYYRTQPFLISPALKAGISPPSIPFTQGAAFWAALLIVFHPLLSLPILGNDFSGILWVKPHLDPWLKGISVGIHDNSNMGSIFPFLEKFSGNGFSHTPFSWSRFVTGGAGGPLSGVVFQVLLILDIGKSILLKPRS